MLKPNYDTGVKYRQLSNKKLKIAFYFFYTDETRTEGEESTRGIMFSISIS